MAPPTKDPGLTAAPNAAPAGHEGVPRGGLPTHVDGNSPDQVASAVAAAVWTWDTRIDVTPQDAARRAVRWMTPGEASTTLRARTGGGGAVWNNLAESHGWTTVTIRRDTEPPPPVAAGQTARRVFVTVTFHDAQIAPQTWAVAMTLARATSGPWQVSAVVSQPESS